MTYTVHTGCRNGFMPDSDDFAMFETVKELREYLRDLKREFTSSLEDWKISVIYPLHKFTAKNLKELGGMAYFEYSPIDATDYYIPYTVEIEYIHEGFCPYCNESFAVHSNGCATNEYDEL